MPATVVMLALVTATAAPSARASAKAAAPPVRTLSVTGVDFTPASDEADFVIAGQFAYGDGHLRARIPFPAEAVVVTSVKFRFYDNAPNRGMCAFLWRANPADGLQQDTLGGACTEGSSTEDPQTLSFPVFARVGGHFVSWLDVSFTATDPQTRLYGATVFYRIVE
jgi:hypothetical protein